MQFQTLSTLFLLVSAAVATPISLGPQHGSMVDVPTYKIREITSSVTINKPVPTSL